MARKSTPTSFSRAGISFNLLLQSVCVVFLFVAANYIGFHYYKRWDLSRSQKFSLSEQTKQVIREFSQPIKIVLYSSPTDQGLGTMVHADTQSLLKELEFSGRRKIEVETIDPSREPGRAREAQAEFAFEGAESSLLLAYGDRKKTIPLAELGDFDLSGLEIGDPPRLVAFKGEAALTAAFIELLDPEKSKVYFVTGHGEREAKDLQLLLEFLDRQNAEAMGLPLLSMLAVPEDADAVCLIAPRLDLADGELEVLKNYWDNGGRLFILLDPDADTPNLHKFLAPVGIIPRDDRVLRIFSSPTSPGTINIIKVVVGGFLPDAAITKRLGTVNAVLPEPTQSLALETCTAARQDVQLRPLIQAGELYWGETRYENLEETAFDEGVDTQPAIVGASAEKGGTAAEETDVATSRMVVVGSGGFLDDEVVRQAPGNLDFAISALNRLLDSSKRTGVVPKTISNFALNLTDSQMQRLGLYTLVVMPGLVALFGLVVAIRRRA